MTMNINLTPQLEQLVRQKVSSGLHNSASEVVREALRLMADRTNCKPSSSNTCGVTFAKGLESGPATPWNVEEMKRAGRNRLAVRSASPRGK